MKGLYSLKIPLILITLLFLFPAVQAHAWPYSGESNLFDLTLSMQDLYFSGESNIFSLADVGSLKVFIEPQAARAAGAQWRLVGMPTWRDSGYTEENVSLVPQLIEFKNIYGWNRPMGQWITVTQNGTTQATAFYVTAMPGKAILEGVVSAVNSQGQALGPVSGATVELTGYGSNVTDEQGRYSFSGLDPGTYSVTATISGHYPTNRENITLGAGDRRSVNLSLTRQIVLDAPASFDFQSPQGKHFIPKMPGSIEFSTKVAWNGSPGSVRFLVNGVWYPASVTDLTGGLARAVVSIPAPQTIGSCSELTIEVTNGAGKVTTINAGVRFSPVFGVIPWYKDNIDWISTKLDLSYSTDKSWEFDLPLETDDFKLSAGLGYALSMKYDLLGATFNGSLKGSGGLDFKIPAPNPDIKILLGAKCSITGGLKACFAGCGAPVVTPSWGISFGGKAGIEAPVVLVLDAIIPGAGTTLSRIPGVNRIKLKLYQMPGGGLSGVYEDGESGDCLFGSTSTSGTVTGGIEAKLEAKITKNLKTGVYAGGKGQFDMGICPDLQFKGFGGALYAGAYAEWRGFEYDNQVAAQIYWDFSESRTPQAHVLSITDISEGDPSQTWRPVGKRPLKWGETNRLVAQDISGRHPLSDVEPLDVQEEVEASPELCVVENVIGLAGPKVRADNSYADILFVMHDTDKPWYGATDIGRVFWDENTAPQLEAVTDDLLAEFSPEFVKIDDNSLLAAWTRVEGDVSGVESPEDISPHVEIVSSFFDRTSNTWSAPLRLTSNSQLDRDPLPVLFGETTGILWVQNEGTAMIGDEADGDSLLFSTWTGSGWSEPTALWSAPKGILEFAFGSDGEGQGHVVFSVDEDGDTETLEDRELYSISTDNGSWQTAVRLTNNDVEDSLPVLVAPEGNLMLVWKSGERMLYTSLSDWNPADVYPENTVAENSPALAGVTLPGGAAVAYSVQHEDGVDIVAAFYDAALDLWSLPRQLTHDEHAESFVSMAFDGEALVLAYLKTQTLREDIEVELNGETRVIENAPRPGRTDLYILRHELGSGLSVKEDSLTVEPKNPSPGSQAAVRAVLVNEGDIPLEGVDVRLYSGDPSEGGQMIAETVVPGPLTAGASEDVAFTWDVPEDPNSHILYVVADPDMAVEDPDRSNNTESIWTVLPDIAVESTWSEEISGTQRNLIARVTNRGVIPTGSFELSWRLGSEAGQEIGRSPISGLGPSAEHDVSFVWDYPNGANGDSTAVIYAVADPDDVVFELDTSNNSFFHATEVHSSGSLLVNLEVPEALTGEAGWRRTGTDAWLESGYTEVLDPGDYTVEFKPVPGWNTPENQTVTVSSGATTEITGRYTADFAGGDGTEGNPYKVASANQLNNIRYHLSYPGRYFTLSNDIDLNTSPWNEGSGWEPIGTHEAPFTGSFDGNGHLISNLFINRPDMDEVGLFGVLDEGPRIINVGLTDVYVAGNNDVGGLVGCSLSVVDRAYVSGQVFGSENGENIGGLVGINAGSVTESYSTVNVSGFTNVGGLVGLSGNGVIDDCYATGFVNGSDAIGGLVGRANGGYIRWSYATGLVELNQEGGNQGGLVGISEKDPTITDSYWNTETSLQEQSAGGAGLSTVQMRESASYTGWEFGESNTWNRADEVNGGYPYLTFSTLHTISVSVTPENSGSVEWAGSYPHGATARLNINPEAGHTIGSVSGCDGSLEGDIYTISPVTQPCYVTVQFSIDQYILAGDVNEDDKIDLADAILALQVISGISVSNKVHKGADIDGDNRIGFAEAVYILQELSKGETQQEGFLRSPASYDSDPVYMASDMEAMIDGFSEFTLDFVNNWEGSRNTINQWVEDQTNDKIKDLLPQGSITPDTAVVLTNAIYFKRSWYKKFEEELTAPGPFYRLDGTTVTSDMMHGRLDTRYARGRAGFDAVELPS